MKNSTLKFDLIFGDPPFNIDQDYQGYNDKIDRATFVNFTCQWIKACWDSLSPTGVLALHGPDDLAEMYLNCGRAFGMTRIDWINWHYNFNQNPSIKTAKRFGCTRCHLIVFAKDPNEWTFNAVDVKVDSLRRSVYKDKRANPNDEDYEGGGSKVPGSVWGIPSDGANFGRVQGNSRERWTLKPDQVATADGPQCSHPNQLPERYLERIVRAFSNPEDRFLDAFGGSGTGITVAAALGREATTTEICPICCRSIENRLKRGAIRV